MKTKISVFASAFCAFVLLGTSSAFAAGTPAGTVITNTATMTYRYAVGNEEDTTTATANITVEKSPGVALSIVGSTQFSSDRDTAYFPHIITNTGNDVDNFNIGATDDSTWADIIIDANGNGAWDPGENTSITSISNLMADSTYRILVRVIVPNGVGSPGNDSILTTVTSTFVDTGGVTYDSATASVTDVVITQTADVVVTKGGDNATPMPGETVTYTVGFTNDGTGVGQNAYMRDTLSSNLTFVSANIGSGGGSVDTNVIAGGLIVVEWTNIGVNGSITSGMTGSLTIVTTVNEGVAAGTDIMNRAYIVYTDSLNGDEETPRGGPYTITVDTDRDWSISTMIYTGETWGSSATDSVEVTDTKLYRIRIVNTGNDDDQASIGLGSSDTLTWALYRDVDENGVYTFGTDVAYTFGSATGTVTPGDSILFFAFDSVAQTMPDRSLDTAKYMVSPNGLGASDSASTYTRVKAPVMVLSKSVVGKTNNRSRPGDTLIYTITYSNNGSSTSNLVVITDAAPTNTVLLTNGYGTGEAVQLNGVDMTNASDPDEVTVSGNSITISLGSVGSRLMNDASHTGTITFMVKID